MGIKKILFSFVISLFCVSVNAQDIKLVLNDSCEFVSQDGKSYIVLEYPGKTAHEIYEGILTNVVKCFNDAKNVTNTVPDRAISVRAFSDNLIEYCWWKEPKKFTLGKAALAYVTAGISLAVDAIDSGCFYNGDFSVSGFYKIDIEIKDGKAKVNTPLMDGISSVIDRDGNKKISISSFSFKEAVRINRDKSVATRDKQKNKAKEANLKKEKYLKEAVDRIERTLNAITKLQDTDW